MGDVTLIIEPARPLHAALAPAGDRLSMSMSSAVRPLTLVISPVLVTIGGGAADSLADPWDDGLTWNDALTWASA